ncbi:uncharacterized protein KGF55_003309 [Candida pseudojiufengensis]|uniref:uncharacterized protein n=1 Tax=Candida pseudojiufengensis TaxID=497109 RepID=UPI00222537EB|nr:uncharacterized protein KGF55_003309 [Candida pseudojiufengensis]KAI5962233.1 hypothetical protein KGF55_003309 [Candida pseudojiufengensis]
MKLKFDPFTPPKLYIQPDESLYENIIKKFHEIYPVKDFKKPQSNSNHSIDTNKKRKLNQDSEAESSINVNDQGKTKMNEGKTESLSSKIKKVRFRDLDKPSVEE